MLFVILTGIDHCVWENIQLLKVRFNEINVFFLYIDHFVYFNVSHMNYYSYFFRFSLQIFFYFLINISITSLFWFFIIKNVTNIKKSIFFLEHNGISSDLSTGWVVASESCAFLSFTRYIREVLPGEIIEITTKGIKTVDIVPRPNGHKQAFCIFEYVYFARPNTVFEGQEVYTVRSQCGRQLALEHPVEADVVGSVPESGNAAAHGYSRQVKTNTHFIVDKCFYFSCFYIYFAWFLVGYSVWRIAFEKHLRW